MASSNAVPNTQAGEQVFHDRCIVCHGLYGNTRNENSADLQVSRIDSISIVQTVRNGIGRLPPFDGSIPDSEMASLVMFVKSLRKG